MKKVFTATVAAALLASSGCTTVNTASLPSDRSGKGVFVTAGDIPEPYESLGFVQVQRAGVRLFGFWDVVGTDIQTGLRDVLLPQIEEMGGDGAINVRFRQVQYAPVTQAVFAVFFFIPLPTNVVVTAEVVKLKQPTQRASSAGR